MKCLSLRKTIQQTVLAAAGITLLAQAAVAAPTIEKKVKIEAGGIYQIVHNAQTDSVYVAVTGDSSVVVLDDETLEIKGSIDVSESPLFGLTLNAETQTLYGTATRTEQVAAVDIASGKIVGAVSHGETGHVREVAVDETNNLIYVTVLGQRRGNNPDAPPSEVWVINGETNELDHVITNPTQTATGLALNEEAGLIYVSDMNLNHVVVINAESQEVVNTWPVGGESPMNVVYDGANNRLLFANQGSGTLTVLDATSGELLKSVETGEGALGVAFNEKANQIYVANRRAGTTSVIDGTSYEILANLETGTFPQTITINEDDNLVYVSNKAQGRGRNAPADAPPVVDDNGDTVVIIRP